MSIVDEMDLLRKIKNLFKMHQEPGKKWLISPRTRVVHIEFTSRCNLSCIFCASSQSGYKGMDIDVETIKNTIQVLKKRKVKIVSVNGHGETTIYKNWHLYCNEILDMGIPVHIISNFAKEFSKEELQTLSRFKTIEISCDTNDPELLKKLRRGIDLKILCINISRLKETALNEKRRLPSISFSCVVSDLNVFHLPDYVVFGKALGVTHFNFCNLTKYPDLNNTLNANHITEMPVELLPKVKATLDKTFEFLQNSHIEYHFQQGLLDSLNQKIEELNSLPLDKGLNPGINKLGPHWYSSARKGLQTRYCLDPWDFILLQSNKDVLPCCVHPPIHSLGKHQSLSDSFNSTQIKDLRRRLLTGNLSPYCLNCPVKGWTSIRNLRKKVWNYLNPGIYRLLPFRMMTIEPEVFIPFEVRYNEGWYSLETDTNIPNLNWQSWRWTSKNAVCMLKNPQKKALLIIQGGVNKSVLPDQKVFIKLNGIILDEFIPGNSKFFKEYTIELEMMGDDKMFLLTIEVDKIFVPSLVIPGANDNRELGVQIHHLFFGENI